MDGLTAAGLSPFALSAIVVSVVAGCTILVAIVGVLIDRSAARHAREKGR